MTMLDPKGREAARLWAINATSDGGVPGDDYIDGILTAYLSTITPAEDGGLVERLWAQAGSDLINVHCRRLFVEAATALASERAAHAETKRERDEAIKAAGDQATLRGEAEGKLAASEMAGIVDGWKRRAEAYRTQLDEALKALEPFADIADLIDCETEGMSETDELALHFHDYLMASWPVSLFRAARRVRKGGKVE